MCISAGGPNCRIRRTVLEAAVNGRADALVTCNIRDFEAVKDRFGLRVIRPSELLEEIRK
jgi:predicted nucleic acid-binding protein